MKQVKVNKEKLMEGLGEKEKKKMLKVEDEDAGS